MEVSVDFDFLNPCCESETLRFREKSFHSCVEKPR